MTGLGALVLLGLALLAAAGGLAVRLKLRGLKKREDPELTEEMIRRIEEEGQVETDEREPLDWDEIREEEDRFWSETWDEPDEPFFR
ncbi:MAG: hypothetical protein ACOC83_04095 [Gemmatimonadota bacterium]